MAPRTSVLLSLLVAVVGTYIYRSDYQLPFLTKLSTSQWDALNKQVGGRLLPGAPSAKSCFPPVNETACAPIRAHYLDGLARYPSPGAMVNPNWETCHATGEQCLLNFLNPADPVATSAPHSCQMGSIASHYIDVRNAEDVIAAYKFSESTGIPLVIHSTGHDYQGRSSAPNSLGLWMHNLKSIKLEPSFVPEGCKSDTPSVKAVNMGAGVQFLEAYEFAEANHITIVGGSDKGVGAVGGWLQGGGHSPLSVKFGLGVDRALQFKIVTPDGQFRIANKCQNEDLFWALRGGGGGTFGVVLEATVAASPQVTTQVTLVGWPGGKPELTQQFWTLMVDNALTLSENGYSITANDSLGMFISPSVSPAQAATVMKPFTDFGKKLKADGVEGLELWSRSYSSFLPAFRDTIMVNPAINGVNVALSSRLVPKSAFSTPEARAILLKALMELVSTSPYLLILGTAPSQYKDDGLTSVTEAWRESLWHIPVVVPWNFDTPLEMVKGAYALADKAVDPLRAITPDAAYQNEASVHEPNYKVSFWGTNYDKLLAIKNKYDPKHLLDCWHCIGWQENNSRYKCYI